MATSSLFGNKTRNVTAASFLALGSALAALNVNAATATDNLAVSAEVTANCSIATVPLAFGTYDPVVANATNPLEGAGTVSVTCTNGAAVSITLNEGINADTGSSATDPMRRMVADGTNYLSYTLYSDSARTTVWGNDATVDVETTGTGTADQLQVYGSVAAGQNVPQGSYTDTVVATVTF